LPILGLRKPQFDALLKTRITREMPSGGQNKVYSEAIASEVERLIANGSTLVESAKAIGVDPQTVTQWLLKYADFDTRITRARQVAAHIEVDDLKRIAETEPDVNRARLRCDVTRWIAGKRVPLVYGDRIDVNVSQTVNISESLRDALARKDSKLLPRRYPEDIQDAELIETKQIEHKQDSDSKSDDDIFS
jgi:hypothetical protein